jgi:intracellular septation protein
MKFLFDLFPVILFFSAFKVAEGRADAAASLAGSLLGAIGLSSAVAAAQAPILLATLAAIVGTIGQITWVMGRGRKVDGMLWVSLVLIVVFGGATLILRDENFIKWKPTVLYWVIALVLLGSTAFFGRNLIRKMMEEQMPLPEFLWGRLNAAWAGFFFVMGALNLVIAFNFPTPVWVNFKLFGGMGLMVLFVMAQTLMLSKHIKEKP